ncbi:MAG: hypothetical protein QF464_14740 [Myxococcota bacterium]|nr:hypothetical protein [Myxococcota bacterium]
MQCSNALRSPSDLAFRLYDSAGGGDPLWEQNHAAVPMVRGTFDVALGSLSPVDLIQRQGPTRAGTRPIAVR